MRKFTLLFFVNFLFPASMNVGSRKRVVFDVRLMLNIVNANRRRFLETYSINKYK